MQRERSNCIFGVLCGFTSGFANLGFVKEKLPALTGLPNLALNPWRRDLAIPSARVRNLYFYGSLARLSGNQLGQ